MNWKHTSGLVAFFLCLILRMPAADGIAPLLAAYCYDCHADGSAKAGLALDQWPDERAMRSDHALWKRVQRAVFFHDMPPANKTQPSESERLRLLKWIDSSVFQIDCSNPDPGRVTVRRLNRVEYNNTIRDLLGVDLSLADDFPVDDSGHGFDTIGDALSLPPILMEKYLAASRRALDAALGLHRPSQLETRRFQADALEVGYNARQQGDGWVLMNSIEEDDIAVTLEIPTSGSYIMRTRAWAEQKSERPIELTFMFDQYPVGVVTVGTNRETPYIYETRLRALPGRHRFRAVVRRLKDGLTTGEALRWKSGDEQKGAVFAHWLEVVGPLDFDQPTELAREWFSTPPTPGQELESARPLVQTFARRSFRRPVTSAEVDRLMVLAQRGWSGGMTYEQGVELALQAVLVSPHFLFRAEGQPRPDDPLAIHLVDEHALAARLSYFIWSSMPDQALFDEADRGTLRRNLRAQVRRMLRNSKAHALVENFAGQWLQFRNLDTLTFDRERFPAFNEGLRESMRQETRLFCKHILREDRSILEFLSADYTFANKRLATFYGLPDAGGLGDRFERVSLMSTQRRGVLTQGSVLALTSNPTRTSPVKRGKWVMDNLLNTPPPPPPPDVPDLKEGPELTGTLRERMEQHRRNPLCASCHQRMDDIGFGLENFDAIGRWREEDGEAFIDASGKISPGQDFRSPVELVNLLAKDRRDQFVRCLADKMLTYALGRGTEYSDKCALDEICARLERGEYRFSELVMGIVESVPFQMRRGEGP